ncbi:HpcH/HpaI aldolase/citrate lyase family protein [Nocardia aobensis]|uniref:HpcH/HpaI aldolase/citrate lyase family protein n=1 Tax=Nocardia aobensis TaxID=257277 RepID=UPI000317AA21|nr:aldolase/citrate lyase family protein [Nocardia aobensis]
MTTTASPSPTGISFDYARSWLLVAAHRPDAVDEAVVSSADVVVFDLEDAVPAELKAETRTIVAQQIRSGRRAWVRINDVETPYWADDLAELGSLPELAGVVLAKVEHAGQIDATAAALSPGTPIVALLESAAGIEAAAAVAARSATARLAFGSGDFRLDTGMSDSAAAMAYARSRLTVASRAAGLPGPIDGPTVSEDEDRLHADTAAASALGMTARICLREGQVTLVNRDLSPSHSDIIWATGILDNDDVSRDGSYRPQLARARSVLDRARIYSCPMPKH